MCIRDRSYEDLGKEDYTEDSWNTFEAKVKEAEGLLANGGASAAEVNEMIASLKDLKHYCPTFS